MQIDHSKDNRSGWWAEASTKEAVRVVRAESNGRHRADASHGAECIAV